MIKKNDSRNRKKTLSQNEKPSFKQSFGFHLECLNKTQEEAISTYFNNDLMFFLGAAGSGKTHMAIGLAIQDLLQNRVESIVITRPVVEAGESLGYLPGTIDEKIGPYVAPIYHCIDRIVGKDTIESLKVKSALKIVPLAYMRGLTFLDSVVIVDESQNCSLMQLKLAITRLGVGSKMILTGDQFQSDLPGKPAIIDLMEKVGKLDGVGIVRFKEEDIVRHSLVAKILKAIQ